MTTETTEPTEPAANPPQPPRAPFRRYYSLPPWFAEEASQNPQPADLKERLTEWFRQQRLAQERRNPAEPES